MALGLGFKGGILGFGEEATNEYGTAVARTKFVEMTSDGLGVEEERIESATLNAIYSDEDNVKRGTVAVSGDVETEMRYEGAEVLLKHALGECASSTEQASFTVVGTGTGENDNIDFKEDAGAELHATVAAGSYIMGESGATDATLCKAIKTGLEAAGAGTYTVTFSNTTKKITIAVSGAKSAVQFLWKTGTSGSDNTDLHIGTLIGFSDAADSASEASHTGDSAVVTVFKHTFKLTDSLPTGLTFEADRDTYGFVVEGGKINTLGLSTEVNGFLKMALGIIGEDMTTGSVTEATLPTAPLISFDDIVITYSGSQDVKTMEVSLNNNLKTDRYYLNSRLIKEPERSARIEVTGSITIEFNAITEYDLFRAATSGALVATATGATIKTGHAYEMVITLGQIKLTGGVPKIADVGIIPLELPFKAYAADSSNREMVITLTNTISSV